MSLWPFLFLCRALLFIWYLPVIKILLFILFICPQEFKTVIPAKVVSIYDGDTITVEFTIKANIRLKDCWTPEIRSKDKTEREAAIAAKKKLESLIKPGDTVTVEIPYEENFSGNLTLSRILAIIYKDVDGDGVPDNLSKEMVKSGLAKEKK